MKNNKIHEYAQQILRNESARIHSSLRTDLEYLFSDSAVYLPNWLCPTNDLQLFQTLQSEFVGEHAVQWSRHFKFEDPQFSKTFNQIIKQLEDYFQVDILATRLNYYPDGSSWKPFHHDSHAFSNGKQEDFTMGVSLGNSRKLAFRHPSSDEIFQFPQHNGDVFAFNSEVNKRFMHGVPKTHETIGPRFSIIAWGKRRNIPSLNMISNQESKGLTVKRSNRLLEKIQSKTSNGSRVQGGWDKK
jgi:hypothetical protein